MMIDITKDESKLLCRLLKSNKDAWASVIGKSKDIANGYVPPIEVLKEMGSNESLLNKLANVE